MRIEQAKQEIASLNELESRQVLVKTKLSRLQEINASQPDLASLWMKMLGWLPAGVVVNDVKVEAGKSWELVIKSGDVRAVAELLANLEEQSGTLESLTKSSVGEYVVALSFTSLEKR